MELMVEEKIRIVLKRKGKTLKDLAEITGQSRQNLYNKMSRGSFTVRDLEIIADAIGCTFYCGFEMDNGEKI